MIEDILKKLYLKRYVESDYFSKEDICEPFIRAIIHPASVIKEFSEEEIKIINEFAEFDILGLDIGMENKWSELKDRIRNLNISPITVKEIIAISEHPLAILDELLAEEQSVNITKKEVLSLMNKTEYTIDVNNINQHFDISLIEAFDNLPIHHFNFFINKEHILQNKRDADYIFDKIIHGKNFMLYHRFLSHYMQTQDIDGLNALNDKYPNFFDPLIEDRFNYINCEDIACLNFLLSKEKEPLTQYNTPELKLSFVLQHQDEIFEMLKDKKIGNPLPFHMEVLLDPLERLKTYQSFDRDLFESEEYLLKYEIEIYEALKNDCVCHKKIIIEEAGWSFMKKYPDIYMNFCQKNYFDEKNYVKESDCQNHIDILLLAIKNKSKELEKGVPNIDALKILLKENLTTMNVKTTNNILRRNDYLNDCSFLTECFLDYQSLQKNEHLKKEFESIMGKEFNDSLNYSLNDVATFNIQKDNHTSSWVMYQNCISNNNLGLSILQEDFVFKYRKLDKLQLKVLNLMYEMEDLIDDYAMKVIKNFKSENHIESQAKERDLEKIIVTWYDEYLLDKCARFKISKREISYFMRDFLSNSDSMMHMYERRKRLDDYLLKDAHKEKKEQMVLFHQDELKAIEEIKQFYTPDKNSHGYEFERKYLIDFENIKIKEKNSHSIYSFFNLPQERENELMEKIKSKEFTELLQFIDFNQLDKATDFMKSVLLNDSFKELFKTIIKENPLDFSENKRLTYWLKNSILSNMENHAYEDLIIYFINHNQYIFDDVYSIDDKSFKEEKKEFLKHVNPDINLFTFKKQNDDLLEYLMNNGITSETRDDFSYKFECLSKENQKKIFMSMIENRAISEHFNHYTSIFVQLLESLDQNKLEVVARLAPMLILDADQEKLFNFKEQDIIEKLMSSYDDNKQTLIRHPFYCLSDETIKIHLEHLINNHPYLILEDNRTIDMMTLDHFEKFLAVSSKKGMLKKLFVKNKEKDLIKKDWFFQSEKIDSFSDEKYFLFHTLHMNEDYNIDKEKLLSGFKCFWKNESEKLYIFNRIEPNLKRNDCYHEVMSYLLKEDTQRYFDLFYPGEIIQHLKENMRLLDFKKLYQEMESYVLTTIVNNAVITEFNHELIRRGIFEEIKDFYLLLKTQNLEENTFELKIKLEEMIITKDLNIEDNIESKKRKNKL